MTPYEILGVRENASGKEIKHAHRDLAKRYHPDTSGYDSAEHFRRIEEAYKTLMARLPKYGASAQTSSTVTSQEEWKRWRERHPAKTPEERAAEERAARKREKTQAAYARRKQAVAEKAAAEAAAAHASAAAAKQTADLRSNVGDHFTDGSGRVFVKVGPSSWKQVV